MHQMVANILQINMQTTQFENYKQAKQLMDNALATAIHATRCAVNHTMKATPGELVYCCDMFIDIPVIANLIAIWKNSQLSIGENLRRHNCKYYNYHYRFGDWVMIKIYDPDKMWEKLHGLYQISELRTNGTIQVQQDPTSFVEETFNIQKN